MVFPSIDGLLGGISVVVIGGGLTVMLCQWKVFILCMQQIFHFLALGASSRYLVVAFASGLVVDLISFLLLSDLSSARPRWNFCGNCCQYHEQLFGVFYLDWRHVVTCQFDQ